MNLSYFADPKPQVARFPEEASSLAMKLIRVVFVRANDLDRRRSMESIVETLAGPKHSRDAHEAMAAFADKREASYQGRQASRDEAAIGRLDPTRNHC